MATSVSQLVSSTVSAVTSAATPSSTLRATPQAGVLEGISPVIYNASNPIILFIVQASIVIIFCQLLHYPLRLIHQPRVIAEVIGGILLGPSAMMRIPGFQNAIFPALSMPIFSNVANLGLILFLFLVGLEVDVRMFVQNWRVAVSVGVAGMLLPFGLGFAIARGIYNQFRAVTPQGPISFGVYGLFIGTAMAITAFPVLCRILTELKLLGSNVGVSTLAAGVGNDVTGWILLALCVALVNNASGLTALWALLCVAGWALFLVFPVRRAFRWILSRTGSIQNGPTQAMVALTVLLVIISAWFTGIVGVHPIFGAFLVGLICPHDGGFAIKLTEKLEDLVSVFFLPLYFALSGLSTDLGLLNDGMTWAYVVGIIACAFAGKIIGGTLAARSCKLRWRESATIGVLMSCKGLVELIVLLYANWVFFKNVGYQANILTQTTFTMFVVMALVTTVATTPLVKWLYPPWYQQKVDRWRRGEIDWDGHPIGSEDLSHRESFDKLQASRIRRLVVYLRLDSLPSLFTFISLLGSESTTVEQPKAQQEGRPAEELAPPLRRRPLEVNGIRLLELTQRTSSVMQVTEGEEYYAQRDPVVNAFRTFSRLNDVAVSGKVAVVPPDSYAETLLAQAEGVSADFVLLPWSEYGSITEDQSVPFAVSSSDRFSGRPHLEFVQKALQKAVRTCNIGIFINKGFGGALPTEGSPLKRTASTMSMRSNRDTATLPVADKSHQIFFPFFGGLDDQQALRFVLQLAKNTNVTVSIVHFSLPAREDGDEISTVGESSAQFKPQLSRKASKAAKEAPEEPSTKPTDDDVTAQDLALLATVRNSLPAGLAGRVTVSEVSVTAATAASEVLDHANKVVGKSPKNAGDVVVVGRRHSRLGDRAADSGGADLKRTIGVVGSQMVQGGVGGSVLVIQAGGRALNF